MKTISQARLKLIKESGGKVTVPPTVEEQVDSKVNSQMSQFFSEFTTLIQDIRKPEIVEKIVPVEKVVEKIVEKIVEVPKVVEKVVEIERPRSNVSVTRDGDGMVTKVSGYKIARNSWGLAESMSNGKENIVFIRDDQNRLIGTKYES